MKILCGTAHLHFVTIFSPRMVKEKYGLQNMSFTDSQTMQEPNSKKLKPSINSIWVVFDLETTGFNRVKDEIIEIGARILGDDGKEIDNGSFLLFIKPKNRIPSTITELTGINNHNVCNAAPFSKVGYHFFQFIFDRVSKYELDNNISVDKIVLVAHNGKSSDLPFLLHSLKAAKIWNYFDMYNDYLFILDTLHLCRKVLQHKKQYLPNYRLSTLYQHVTGKTLDNHHRAMEDVESTISIFQYPIFWEKRMDFVECIDWDENILDKKMMETQMEICQTIFHTTIQIHHQKIIWLLKQ